MLEDPEPIPEPDPPGDDWVWPVAANGRARLERLGVDGRYALRGIFGDGGQAYIWYALDTGRRDTPVAIKTLRPDGSFGGGRVAARRMTREARIMQSIPAHPHVMPLLDCGPRHLVSPESRGLRPRPDDQFESRNPWLVMPLTPHRNLSRLIAAGGSLSPDAWLRLARGYAAGLSHLHHDDIKVVHRDLSPGNVLLTADGPMITDFGVSWAPSWVPLDESIEQAMSTGLTRQATGRTEDWHAPELINSQLDEHPDREFAADIFCWGLFVATASGRRHPWSKNPGSTGLEEPERVRMYRGDPAFELDGPIAAADVWAELVSAALALDPADRPSAAELVAVLDGRSGRTRRPAPAPAPAALRTAASASDVSTTVRDAEAVEAAEILCEALRERWRSDPAWSRVGAGPRLPIHWQVVRGAAESVNDDVSSTDLDATSRLVRVLRHGGDHARTVVLGAPGSGKSELLLGLFRRLINGWTSGDPLPLLVPLASWEPALSDLRTWLVEWLHVNYRFLDRAARSPVPKTLAAKLLDDAHLALVLDGLDEVLEKAQPRLVVEQLNGFDGPARILVSSRAGNRAVAELFPSGNMIVLGSQQLDDVIAYLRGNAADEQAWDPVVAELPQRLDLAGVLSTPLMVMLADTGYNSGDEHRPRPRELLDLRGAETITQHLLSGFVPSRYAPGTGRYAAVDAGRWLGYLARMTADSGELRWWDMRVMPAPTSKILLHVLTLAAVAGWTAVSAGVMNAWIFGSGVTGMTQAIRISAAALLCYGALHRVTGSYPGAVLAAVGAYIAGTVSGSYDLAIGAGLAAGFSWRPLSPRTPGRFGDVMPALQVGMAAVVVSMAIRGVSLLIPLDSALVTGFAAGTFDGFALRWDGDVNGWLAIGLVPALLTWIGIRVASGGAVTVGSRLCARPEVQGLVVAVAVGAIDSWADAAYLGVDRPWLLGPGDGLAAGLAVWWTSSGVGRRAAQSRHGLARRLVAAGSLGAITAALNALGYAARPDVSAGLVRALAEGAAVAVLLAVAGRDRPRQRERRRTLWRFLPPSAAAGAVGLAIGALYAQSAGVAEGTAEGAAVALTVLFFMIRNEVQSGADRVDPVEAGIVGLTVVGLLAGFAYALLFGLVTGLASRVSTDIARRTLPSLRANAPFRRVASGGLLGVMATVTAAANGLPVGWLIVIALTGGVAGAFAFGIRGDEPDNRLAASPRRLFRQDRKVFLRMTVVIAVAIAAAVGSRTAAGGQSAAAAALCAVCVLVTYGLTAGLVIAATSTRFGVFAVKTGWLAASDELPWALMTFLDDAHVDKQVLRTAGSAYVFRHELLRERIADLDEEPR